MEYLRAIHWENESLIIVDQTRLPESLSYIKLNTVEKIWEAVKKLKVRGAPAIGIAAGYGVLVAAMNNRRKSKDDFVTEVKKSVEYLRTSRPTAVNLFKVLELFDGILEEDLPSVEQYIDEIEKTALAVHHDDIERCVRIGKEGSEIIPQSATIITHCNTGALATGGMGTALGVIYTAVNEGKKIRVFADETRPLLQGSRLTAYELQYAGIDVTLIADNMAASLMRNRKIDAVLVGADRIAANGDTANKIGTYGLAVMAEKHGVPFYVVAPLTTFDVELGSGREIPIEERAKDELLRTGECVTAPPDVKVFNPAFDVTPHELISGIITDYGIIYKPDTDKVKQFYEKFYNEPKYKELFK